MLVNPSYSVIIEPHWNLKHLVIAAFCNRLTVIIEPHWNLKSLLLNLFLTAQMRNNRTTLESKVFQDAPKQSVFMVIIEPHWNLKLIEKRERADAKSNNRTTLESKGICRLQVKAPMKVIIEPHWNLNSFVMVMQIGTIMSDNRAILVSK